MVCGREVGREGESTGEEISNGGTCERGRERRARGASQCTIKHFNQLVPHPATQQLPMAAESRQRSEQQKKKIKYNERAAEEKRENKSIQIRKVK